MSLKIYRQKSPPAKKTFLRKSYSIHRILGLLVAIPVLVLSITGILLNHSETLGLDKVKVDSPLVLGSYGMLPNSELTALEHGGTWAVQLENYLYFGKQQISEFNGQLKGFLKIGKFLLVASETELRLLDSDTFELIDKLGSESLPEGAIEHIFTANDAVYLQSSKGIFKANKDFTIFENSKGVLVPDKERRVLPIEIKEAILGNFRGKGISLWRLTLDIHSGAFFGQAGRIITDLVAVMLIFLTLTGVYNWWKTSGRKFCENAWPPVCNKQCKEDIDCE